MLLDFGPLQRCSMEAKVLNVQSQPSPVVGGSSDVSDFICLKYLLQFLELKTHIYHHAPCYRTVDRHTICFYCLRIAIS